MDVGEGVVGEGPGGGFGVVELEVKVGGFAGGLLGRGGWRGRENGWLEMGWALTRPDE